MLRIKPFFKSFSFRAGLIIFIIFAMTLVTLRMLVYLQTIEMINENVQKIIVAHIEEIDEGMKHYGTPYVESLIEAIIEDSHDSNLYLGMRYEGKIVGNLPQWPKTYPKQSIYFESFIPQKKSDIELHLLGKVMRYKNEDNAELYVGYNLENIDRINDNLFKVFLRNLALAFFITLFISTLIIYLINRQMQRFNIACDRIIGGDLDYRVQRSLSEDEFDKLADNINRLLDWNKALISIVQDSTNAIAHDMRTPLSQLRLETSQMADNTEFDAKIRKQFTKQVHQIDQLIVMFENILNIAKAESRSGTELFEDINLKALTEDIISFYEPIIEKRKLTAVINLGNQPIMIKGDKNLLGQAIMNLIDNACKYTRVNGSIEITLSHHHGIQLIVADNGPGIPPELRQKAKERFFRTDNSRNTRGYGLGLSLVNAVATLHGGSLSLEDNKPGLRAILRF